MAKTRPGKKTAMSQVDNGIASITRQESAAKRSSSKKAAKAGKSPTKQPAVTSEQIGRAAGEIWQILADHEEQSLAALKKSIDGPGDLVLAAVGWLAREDKLQFTASGRSVRVSLKL